MTRNFSDETLTAFVLGELDEARRAEVEAAIESDTDVKRAVAELEETARLSGEALAAEAAHAPSLTDEQRRAVVETARASAAEEPAEKTSAAPVKIVCSGCGARYSVAAEKVRGRTFKIRCKKCNEAIVIRGAELADDAPAPSEAEPSVAAGTTAPVAEEGGLFDQEPAAPSGGGLFDQEPAAPTGGGVFDQEPAAPTGGGLFDQEPAAPTGGGLFDQPAGDGGGLFGFGATTDAADTGGGVFGGGAGGGGLFDGSTDVDLFGGEDDGDAGSLFTSTDGAPAGPPVGAPQAAMTGQRNENSVLFSLSNLQALAMGGSGGGGGGAMADIMGGGPSTGGGEASGLIDIRALASSVSTDTDGGAIDELMSIGGGGFAPSLGAPVLAPAPREGMSLGAKIGIVGGALAAAGLAVVMVVVLLKGEEPDTSAADQQIATLMAEIEKLKSQGGGGTQQMQALEQQLAKAQETKAGDEATAGGDEAAAGGDEAKDDEDKGKGGKKGGSASKGGSGSASKGGSTPKGGGDVGGDKGGDDALGGGSAPKKSGKGSDELDDLLGGAASGPPKKPKKEDPPAGGGGGGGSGGGGGGGGGGASVPDNLSRQQVQAGMDAVAGSVKACGQGAGGSLTMQVTIAGSGRVTSAAALGAHAGTPVGLCAARAVRRAKFPKFGKSSLTVKYPFKL